MRIIFPYSVRMQENADQNNPKYGHFSRSEQLSDNSLEAARSCAI